MPVDPQIQTLLALRAGLSELHMLSVDDARAQFAARDFPGLRKPEVASVVNRDMQGPGGSLGLRIYTPSGEGAFPLMVFFHGSGFVVCSLDTHDAMCRNLCAGTGCVVVSVDYRLAPEYNFQRLLTIAWPRLVGRLRTRRLSEQIQAACSSPATVPGPTWRP